MEPIKAIPVLGDLIDSSTNKLINDFQQKNEQELLDVILQDDCCAFEALVQKYGESVELSPVLIFSVPEVRSWFFLLLFLIYNLCFFLFGAVPGFRIMFGGFWD